MDGRPPSRRSGSWGRRQGQRSARARENPQDPPDEPTGGDESWREGGTITKITEQVRDRTRSSIFIDGQFAFGLASDLVLLEGLAPNDQLSAEQITALLGRDEIHRATERAMVLLSYRPRSVREVEQRLARNGFPPEAIAAAIGKLTDWGYLNDETFAQRWVENRTAHRPRGNRLLAQELRQKGIDRDTVSRTIDEAEIDELTAALAAGERKASSYASLDPVVARRRLSGFLARRGFPAGIVRQACDRLLSPDPDAFSDDDDAPFPEIDPPR